MKRFCPHCEKIRSVDLIKKTEEWWIDRRVIFIGVKMYKCQNCGTEFATTKMEDENLKPIYRFVFEKSSPSYILKGSINKIGNNVISIKQEKD